MHPIVLRLLTAAIALFAGACAALASEQLGSVVNVHDGDTVTVVTAVDGRIHVRLAGIDAPELAQPGGSQAQQDLAALCLGKQVIVHAIKLDKYGRTVGRVFVGADDCGLHLLRDGRVWLYSQYLRDLARPDRTPYVAASLAAHSAHSGLWSVNPPPEPPWQFRQERTAALFR